MTAHRARECVAAISKRLLHRSANVQLYALTLSDSLSKNAPASIIYPELSSRAFCQTLVRVVNDRNTHDMVKKKTLGLIKEWTQVMQKEADKDGGNGVGAIMKETYDDLKAQREPMNEMKRGACLTFSFSPARPRLRRAKRRSSGACE